MKYDIYLKIERPARKKGGDRYKDVASDFTIYVPQEISRGSEATPRETLKVTFEVE